MEQVKLIRIIDPVATMPRTATTARSVRRFELGLQ